MSLRAHIADRSHHVLRHFALDTDVVLLGVLRLELLGDLTEEQDGTEICPIDLTTGGRREEAVERVRDRSAGLQFERRLEESFRDERASTEGRLRAQLLEHQLFDRVIEDAEAGADTGLTAGARAPGDANTRRPGTVVGVRQAPRDPFIPSNYQAEWEVRV